MGRRLCTIMLLISKIKEIIELTWTESNLKFYAKIENFITKYVI